ncbi:MAG: hypothetical protein MNPFHGCM_02962 [Gemmatimonadaceae bacterium]|nr:hypothetical protein [Gemmatimonadaceae bacterium]
MRARIGTSGLATSIAVACLIQPAVLRPQDARAVTDFLITAPWGSPADSVVRKAANAGWEFVKVDEDSDYVFHAMLHGRAALVFATFGSAGLARIEAAFAPQPANEFAYRVLTDTLTAQYGPASVATTPDGTIRPARGILAAIAWPGVIMALRRDGWLSQIFTCPEASLALPATRGRVAFTRA